MSLPGLLAPVSPYMTHTACAMPSSPTCFEPLGRLVRDLESVLQNRLGEVRRGVRGEPQTELRVHGAQGTLPVERLLTDDLKPVIQRGRGAHTCTNRGEGYTRAHAHIQSLRYRDTPKEA
jgi:hypothetical protein